MALNVGDFVLIEDHGARLMVPGFVTEHRPKYGAYLVSVSSDLRDTVRLILSEDIHKETESELDRMARILYDTGMRDHEREATHFDPAPQGSGVQDHNP